MTRQFSSTPSSQVITSSTTAALQPRNVSTSIAFKDEKESVNSVEGKSIAKNTTTNRWTGLGTSFKSFDSSVSTTIPSASTIPVTENANHPLPSNTLKPSASPKDEKWNYIDPSGILRGPFLATQLQIWYKSGYFNTTLALYGEGEQNSITLGKFFIFFEFFYKRWTQKIQI